MTRARLTLVCLLLVVSFSVPVRAQLLAVTGNPAINANSSGSGCTAVVEACVTVALQAVPAVNLQVSGTFVGTLTFEGMADGTNWVTVQAVNTANGSTTTTATAAGIFAVNNTGYLQVRARATAWTSGLAVVTVTRGFVAARAAPVSTLTAFVTSTCTIADTTETDLWSYTLPALLSAAAKGIRITAFGTLGATANNKTVQLYYGGSSIFNSGTFATNAGIWRIVAELFRTTSASAEISHVAFVFGVNTAATQAVRSNSVTSAVDTTATAVIKVTGLNGTAAANDICLKTAFVEALN